MNIKYTLIVVWNCFKDFKHSQMDLPFFVIKYFFINLFIINVLLFCVNTFIINFTFHLKPRKKE